ncbi:hypothetical protein [Almyronema epifaneia]|uniref:AMIN domain-containing protein n=1 Tax=Almyronema epifaneia S1 TaxID=2991925 RepID=A0ABW6IHS3_9CYAN
MYKVFSAALMTSALLLTAGNHRAIAQNCTENCRSDQIQFPVGEPIKVQVINRSPALVEIEQVVRISPYRLRPTQSVDFDFRDGTLNNVSLVFWNSVDQPLRTLLSRPDRNTLRIEVFPFPYEPSDRSVYVLNDGRVVIY